MARYFPIPHHIILQQGDFQKWKETLRFTTNPRVPIPTGVGPAHVVLLQEYDCTEEITQSPQSLTFRAIKWGDTPVSWEWKLVFPHSNGDAVVASWNTSTSQDDLTWNITNFTMPSNYDWIYQNDGRVAGRIEVICMDPDYHFDAINIIYVPGDILTYSTASVAVANKGRMPYQIFISYLYCNIRYFSMG